MPGLPPFTAEIANLRLGAAIIGIIEISIPVQHLSVEETYLLTFFSLYRKLHISGDLLPKIHYDFSSRCPKNRFCRNTLLFADKFSFLWDEDVFWP